MVPDLKNSKYKKGTKKHTRHGPPGLPPGLPPGGGPGARARVGAWGRGEGNFRVRARGRVRE